MLEGMQCMPVYKDSCIFWGNGLGLIKLLLQFGIQGGGSGGGVPSMEGWEAPSHAECPGYYCLSSLAQFLQFFLNQLAAGTRDVAGV